jgi:predicted nucleic acid-binding Zn ribbon protein
MALEAEAVTVACLGCGQAMAPPRGRMMVCSSRCAKRQWRARRRRERHRVCAACGTDFIPARVDAVFCSLPCKQATYRQRQIAKAVEARRIEDLVRRLIG